MPCFLYGKRYEPAALVRHRNEVADTFGVGRIDIMDNRLVGIKVRGVDEAPAATVLYEAHRELENLVLKRAACTRDR